MTTICHAIRIIFVHITNSCEWNEITYSQHEMQMYNCIITLITLHVIYNLLAPKWQLMLST